MIAGVVVGIALLVGAGLLLRKARSLMVGAGYDNPRSSGSSWCGILVLLLILGLIAVVVVWGASVAGAQAPTGYITIDGKDAQCVMLLGCKFMPMGYNDWQWVPWLWTLHPGEWRGLYSMSEWRFILGGG